MTTMGPTSAPDGTHIGPQRDPHRPTTGPTSAHDGTHIGPRRGPEADGLRGILVAAGCPSGETAAGAEARDGRARLTPTDSLSSAPPPPPPPSLALSLPLPPRACPSPSPSPSPSSLPCPAPCSRHLVLSATNAPCALPSPAAYLRAPALPTQRCSRWPPATALLLQNPASALLLQNPASEARQRAEDQSWVRLPALHFESRPPSSLARPAQSQQPPCQAKTRHHLQPLHQNYPQALLAQKSCSPEPLPCRRRRRCRPD